jgi:hypothetical protein
VFVSENITECVAEELMPVDVEADEVEAWDAAKREAVWLGPSEAENEGRGLPVID